MSIHTMDTCTCETFMAGLDTEFRPRPMVEHILAVGYIEIVNKTICDMRLSRFRTQLYNSRHHFRQDASRMLCTNGLTDELRCKLIIKALEEILIETLNAASFAYCYSSCATFI